MESFQETSGESRSDNGEGRYGDFFDSPGNGQRTREHTRRAMRAAGLGWFSVGLGAAELLAPRAVGRLIGARNDASSRKALRMLGLRELTSGILILTQKKPAPALWSRVVGDLMDLALLGTAGRRSSRPTRLLAATAAVVGVTVVDAMTALDVSRHADSDHEDGALERSVSVNKALTINRPASEVYAFWRDFTNLPSFMSHVARVDVNGAHSRWQARGPAGVELSWEAELTEDRPNELIAWKSLPDALLENQGSVQFLDAPGGRGTEIHVQIRFELPLGLTGFTLGKLFSGIPEQKLENDLRRLKQILETGTVVRSDASIHAGPHPAQASSKVSKGSKKTKTANRGALP